LLVLYEPPLALEALDVRLIDALQAALDDGDPDRAIDELCPAVGIAEHEQAAIRSLEPVWARMRESVRLCPRELRAGIDEGVDQLAALDPPDVPTLYLYGEETDAPSFRTPGEVAELFPHAELRGLAGQRHLAFAFDPRSFAEAILAFTTAHDH
jgi:pimeloyl-ACP methyl ester carboxylesterase